MKNEITPAVKEKIRQKAAELEITFPEIGINGLVGLLDEGARIQREEDLRAATLLLNEIHARRKIS